MTSNEAYFKEAKYHDFQNYIKSTGHRIEYNGAGYYIIDNEDLIITSGETTEEMYSYILGWQNAHKELEKRIKGLEDSLRIQSEQNDLNIQMYEKVIKDMGGESIENIENIEDESDDLFIHEKSIIYSENSFNKNLV